MLLLLAGGVPALAEVPDSDMVRCATIVADSDRLACYDKLATGVSREAAEAVKARQAAAAEAEKARKAAEEAAARQAEEAAAARKVKSFGAEQAGLGDDDAKLDELTAAVVEAYTDKYGNYLLHLDNGQMWKQLDGRLMTMRSGDQIKLKRAALGSYRLTVVRQKRTVSVKRLK
jgi:hypothetical protein